MTQTYLTRIGGLIRDARRHKGMTQCELAELLGTLPGRRDAHRAGQAEPQPRHARQDRRRPRLRVRLPRPLRPAAPAHRRRPEAQRLDRRQDVQERRRRPALRLAAQPRPHDAAQPRPHRGGQPHPRGARLDRRAHPLAARHERPRDHPARDARPRAHRRRRGPPHAHRHHVPRPAAALARELPAAVCRWLRPRHPHRRAAPVSPALLRPRGDRDARLLRGALGPLRQPGARHRAHRARRHGDRERPHGGCPPRRHDGDPQRQPQLHGAGPLLLPREARRRHRGHRHDDPDGARPRRHRRGRRVLPQRGPDRGDEPARRRRRHRLLDHDPARADRVHRDRARDPRRHGDEVRPHRGVRLGQRPHPPRRRHDDPRPAARPGRQDPPDALPRASTSTTCPSSRSSGRSPRAAR